MVVVVVVMCHREVVAVRLAVLRSLLLTHPPPFFLSCFAGRTRYVFLCVGVGAGLPCGVDGSFVLLLLLSLLLFEGGCTQGKQAN